MIQKVKCGECDKYAKEGHNYCRVCGYHLTKKYVQNVRLAVTYYSHEKFCGYCGGPRNNCKCMPHGKQ